MGLWRWLRAAAVGALALAAGAAGHGFMVQPAARNTDATTNYCAYCLAGGGLGSVYADGRGFPNGLHGVCGDPAGPRPMHEGGGDFQRLNGGLRMTYYAQGSVVTLRVKVTANHGGYFQWKVCKVPDNLAGSATATERGYVTQRCFDMAPLSLLPQGNAYFLDPTWRPPFAVAVQARLPSGLTCARCVVQWHYVTANSCNPPGLPAKWYAGQNMGTCGVNGANPEEFWNCADIGIVPRGQPVPPPRNTGGRTSGDTSAVAPDGSGQRVGPGYGTIDGSSKVYPAVPGQPGGGGPVGGGPDAPAAAGGAQGDLVQAVVLGVVAGVMTGLPLVLLSPLIGLAVGALVCVTAALVAASMRRSSFEPMRPRRLALPAPPPAFVTMWRAASQQTRPSLARRPAAAAR